MADEDYSGEPLTPKNIKTINSLPLLDREDIDPADVVPVQDVSENTYKKASLQDILEWIDKGINQKAFDIAHPVYDPATGHGDIYLQFPSAYDMDTHTIQYNTATPMELYNHNGITSTWVELDFDGAFFRANGGLAETFGGGKQAEELPNIVGNTLQRMIGWHNSTVATVGAITYTNVIENTCPATSAGGNAGYIGIDASKTTGTGKGVYKNNGHVKTENYTIKVWLRTA